MYSRVQRNGKSADNSSTKNQFTTRPFKVEESLPQQNLNEGEVIQNQELSPKRSNIDSNYLLSRISVSSPDDAPPLPRPGIQMKLSIGEGNESYQPEYQPQPATPRLQMKLTIGQAGDKYEQEADRVAKDVVQRINSTDNQVVQNKEQPTESIGQGENFWLSRMSIQPPQYQPETFTLMQRKLSIRQTGEETEPTLDQPHSTPVQPLIQRVNVGGMAASDEVEAGIQRARSGGQPIADSIREPMEQAFRADFSGVRVHTDAQADQLNQSIQAKAFTTGQDVFFRQGTYEPWSWGGQELLAHELTHVVQQGGTQTNSLIQPKLNWDRAQIEARAGKKTGRSEEYKNIVRIVDNYSTLMYPLAASKGLEELIQACDIWLTKHKGETSNKVQARINAIQELMATAKQELSILTVEGVSEPSDVQGEVIGEEGHLYGKSPQKISEQPSGQSEPSDVQGEVIGEEGHLYGKSPQKIPEQPSGQPDDIEESKDNQPSFESFNEKLEQPPKREVLPQKASNQEPEKQGLKNKLVAASNRLIGKLLKRKNPASKIPVSTGQEAQDKSPKNSTKSLTKEDYDAILANIPKNDDDLKAIAKDSKYKSLLRVGNANGHYGQKEYKDSEYYEEFKSSTNFSINKVNRWVSDRGLDKAEAELKKAKEDLENLKTSSIPNSKEVEVAKAQFEAAKAQFEATKKQLIQDYEEQGIKFDPTTARADQKQFDNFKVKYLNETERKDYEMGMSSGQITQQGKPFDTTDHVTVGMGRGWAIFVMSPKGDFYSASHKIGRFHHSSFLSGGAVAGAGEWVVEGGRLTRIYGKTGHYLAGPKQLFQVLEELEERGFNLKGISMIPFGQKQDQDAYNWKQDHQSLYGNKQDQKGDSTSQAYTKTPNDDYGNTPNEVGENDGAVSGQPSVPVPRSNDQKHEYAPANESKHEYAPANERKKESQQEVEEQIPASGVAQNVPTNFVQGHTGAIVSMAMVQAIRNDILATGFNSKWADQSEIVALAKAMGIRIDVRGRGGLHGNSGPIYYLRYNGRDHYDAYLQVSVHPQTGKQQFEVTRIPGNGDCFYKSISEIQISYGVPALEVSAMRSLVNQTLTDQEVADMAVGLKEDFPGAVGLGANFRQLMQADATSHFIDK